MIWSIEMWLPAPPGQDGNTRTGLLPDGLPSGAGEPQWNSFGGPFRTQSQQREHLGEVHQPLRFAALGRRQLALAALLVEQFLKAMVDAFRQAELLQRVGHLQFNG